MIAAIVTPAGIRNIAMMRSCLVSGPAARLDDAGAGRLRKAGLAAFRTVERVAAFGLDLGKGLLQDQQERSPHSAFTALDKTLMTQRT
jgi:hypothetical protein